MARTTTPTATASRPHPRSLRRVCRAITASCEDGDAYDSYELRAGGSVMTDEHGHRDTADGCRHGNAAVAELGPMHTVDEARRASALRDDCHVKPLRLRSGCAAVVSAERGECPDSPRSMWRVSTTGGRLCSARGAASCSARRLTPPNTPRDMTESAATTASQPPRFDWPRPTEGGWHPPSARLRRGTLAVRRGVGSFDVRSASGR